MNNDKVITEETEELEKLSKAELDHRQAVNDMKALLDIPAGVRFVSRLMDKSYVFVSTFRGDSRYDAYNEGKRAFVLEEVLDYVLEANPFKFEDIVMRVKQDKKD